MGVYDIDFPDLSNKLNVPILRQSKFTALLNVLMAQLTWNHSRFFTDYAGGSSYSAYNNGTTYNFGDLVTYRDSINDKKVYLCIATTSVGVLPNTTTNWLLLFDDFVGADQRLLFTNQKLCLEYILNKYFDSTFNQPPTLSDIYITNTGANDMFPVWNEPSVWNSGTTYGANATVKYNGRYWLSLQASNNNKIPDQQSAWWDSEPDVFTRYIASTSYAVATIVRYSYFHYVCIQAGAGNTPSLTGADTAFWKRVKTIWYYEATKTYAIGDVVDYNSNVYMCILGTTGNAPPNATYWITITNGRTYTFPGSQNAGFNIYIPAGTYSNFGGNTTHPNRADESIYRIVRRFWSGAQFRIITY